MTRITVPVLTYLRLSHKLVPAWDRQSTFERQYRCRVVGDLMDRRAVELEFDDDADAVWFALQYGD